MTLFTVALFAACAVASVPHSEHKVNLAQRQRSSRLSRRSGTEPLKDYFLGTDLQWFGNISVGTPPQTLSVVFDTGSPELEFSSTLCDASCNQQHRFNPLKSSTYIDLKFGSAIQFETGIGVTPVVGNNTVLLLHAASDTVAVAGLTAPNVSLFLIRDQTPTFDADPFDGILGLSAEKHSFMGTLMDGGLPGVFGMYLAPQNVSGAEITFGGIDTSKTGNVTPIYAPLVVNQSDWLIVSSAVFVNGQTSSALVGAQDMIFDSGTANLVMDSSIASAIYALVSPEIQPYPAEAGTFGIPCSSVSSLQGEITFQFTTNDTAKTGFNLTMPSSELSVGPFAGNASLCQMVVNALQGVNIIGASVLKRYYSVWDIDQRRLGFVAANGTAPVVIAPTSDAVRMMVGTPLLAVLLSVLLLLL